MLPKKGDRIEITGLLPGDPDPLAIGERGTVDQIFDADSDLSQISVTWDDTRRKLMLLPGDPFRVLGPDE